MGHTFNNPAIPRDALVLLTGANGFIASHIADQLLLTGYSVRGTVRDVSRCSWLDDFFRQRHGSGRFELVQVADFTANNCFDGVMDSAAAVVHTASYGNLSDNNAESAIPKSVRSMLSAMEAAANRPSVQRFVLTSSAWAASAPKPDIEFSIDERTWNDEAVKAALSPGEKSGMVVFMAGKTEAERACWKFIEERKPQFVFNTVLPDTVFGEVLEPSKQGIPSTAGFIKLLFDGENLDFLKPIQPQWFVDVVDTARLHIAALLSKEIANERLFAYAEPWNWNDILRILRARFPEKHFAADMDLGRDLCKVANKRAEDLLRSEFGQSGWVSLEESVGRNVQTFAKM
jgi:nucleoside-diphosphate-sugar epimerase